MQVDSFPWKHAAKRARTPSCVYYMPLLLAVLPYGSGCVVAITVYLSGCGESVRILEQLSEDGKLQICLSGSCGPRTLGSTN